MNPFAVLTASFLFILFSNLANTDEVALVANLGKTSLAQGKSRSNSAF